MKRPVLRLYIAGNTPLSRRAIRNMGAAQTLAGGHWDMRVIDVLAEPALAEQAGIFAIPTLSYDDSSALRRLVGDLSEPSRVLAQLDIG